MWYGDHRNHHHLIDEKTQEIMKTDATINVSADNHRALHKILLNSKNIKLKKNRYENMIKKLDFALKELIREMLIEQLLYLEKYSPKDITRFNKTLDFSNKAYYDKDNKELIDKLHLKFYIENMSNKIWKEGRG